MLKSEWELQKLENGTYDIHLTYRLKEKQKVTMKVNCKRMPSIEECNTFLETFSKVIEQHFGGKSNEDILDHIQK